MSRGYQSTHALRARLDAAFARAKFVPPNELELLADFSKYLCVLTSGYVETVVAELAIDFCRRKSHPNVLSYATRQLAQVQNLRSEKLLQLVGSFDPSWRSRVDVFINGERKDAIDSVIDLRNKIAHGENVTITLSRVEGYYKSIKEIVDLIEQIFT